MLYDKRWDSKKNAKKDDAEVFSLHGLIAWLEAQNPEKEYDYDDCNGNCLLSIYHYEMGAPSRVDGTHYKTCGGYKNYFFVAQTKPWTFGAALSRARKIAESA